MGRSGKMKEKIVLMTLILVASMLVMCAVPVRAWEYWDTTVANPQTDDLVDFSGPHCDRIQIRLFANELAEFQALEAGSIDVTDWPISHNYYVAWTNDPLQQDIAVVNTGPEFGMYILDMRLDNRTFLDPPMNTYPNPAMTTPFGNPMADVWLRRAIATCVDRKQQVEQIVSGGIPPWLGAPMYTPLSSAYGDWVHPQLNPNGTLAAYTYVKPDGTADVAKGNQFLDDHGYNIFVNGKRTKNGVPFTIKFYIRTDDNYRYRFATRVMQPRLTEAPPNGLGLDVQLLGFTSAAIRSEVMAAKRGHMYTGGWGLTEDPDHLYYLFHVDNYWHPGRPPNFMYYPGDANTYHITGGGTYDGKNYGNDLVPYGAPALNFSDPDKTWLAAENVWENPQNYWSWEMMTATGYGRALTSTYKSQEALAYLVCGEPIWAAASYTAFHRRYVGTPGVPDEEDQWEGQPWKGVVNQRGFGVWSTMSFYDMHPANALFGDGQHMTVRWGFREPIVNLNPIYAEWTWDWYVLNQCYDSLIDLHPYKTDEIKWLAHNWSIGTWDSSQYGTCTKITFNLRHDVLWSDGMPFTASDVKFTWGGPLVRDSLSWWLASRKLPPAYWSTQVADIVSIFTPDPWTVIVYLDVYSYFGLHSMSGFNIVLPEHVWKSIVSGNDPAHPDVTDPWNMPCIATGGYVIDSTADPTPIENITLHKNPLHFRIHPTQAPKDIPIDIWTTQTSNATTQIGNTHWIYRKQGQTGANVHVKVYLHSNYAYETGFYKSNTHNNTTLDGHKNVTLWIWNGQECPNQEENYVLYRTLATNVTFAAPFCTTEVEEFDVDNLPAWWYYVKIDAVIESLEVDGAPVNPSQNPYNGMQLTYKEKMIITSRYDLGGIFWKPCPPATPEYQAIADLKTNVKDTYACAHAFGSRPGYPNWNAVADVNEDFKIDVKDYYGISQDFGWTAPNPLGP
jgi:ABC-type transport system substrate-binding protein